MLILDLLLVINHYAHKTVLTDTVDVSEFYKKKINDKKGIGIITFHTFNYFFFL